ncbi:MAG: 5-formyltetrahydrofolate cyclo-ligase [Thermoplasmatota archaeon]
MIDKKILRKKLSCQRRKKSTGFIQRNSKLITKELMNLPIFDKSKHILFYVSYNGEVYTHQIIKESIRCNKETYVPLSITKTHSLQISKLNHFTDLKPGAYGILEPIKEKQQLMPIKILDLIIVPGVAFDTKGNRIGQGGGYYDWLLNQSNATSVALTFDFQIIPSIPTEAHDQTVDYIITEKQIIDCDKP